MNKLYHYVKFKSRIFYPISGKEGKTLVFIEDGIIDEFYLIGIV